MTLAYQQLTTYEEDNWNEFLNKICLIDIFKDLFQVVEKSDFKYAVKYIAYCYSIDSDAIVLGTEWYANKLKIYSRSELPEIYSEYFLQLKNDIVLNVINRWLEFQQSDTWMQLMVLKDLKIEMQLSANSSIKKSSGEIDFDQKYKNANYATDLTKKIKDLEMELIQNSPKLKEAVMEVKNASKSQKITPEKFAV